MSLMLLRAERPTQKVRANSSNLLFSFTRTDLENSGATVENKITQDKTRQDETIQDKTRQDDTKQDKTKQIQASSSNFVFSFTNADL